MSTGASDHRACETLTRLTIEHLPRDTPLGRSRRWRKGSVIWVPTGRADRIFFLEAGQVTVMIKNPPGHDVIVRVVNVGEAFGELCFCAAEGGLWHTQAAAVSDSRTRQVPYEDFLRYLQDHRQALGALAFSLCAELSHAERRIGILAERSADQRLGQLLLHLALRARQGAQPSTEAVVEVSHDELARMAAMSRSHVTVTMGTFRRRGLVRYGRDQPLVVHVAVLRAFLTREVPPNEGASS